MCGYGSLTGRCNCCDKGLDGSWTHLWTVVTLARGGRISVTQWDCRRMWRNASSLINADDRRDTFLLVSLILMIRDESPPTTHPPPHNDNVEELRVSTGHPRGIRNKTRSHRPPTINIDDRIGPSHQSSILMIGDDFYLSMKLLNLGATNINLLNEISPCPTDWTNYMHLSSDTERWDGRFSFLVQTPLPSNQHG